MSENQAQVDRLMKIVLNPQKDANTTASDDFNTRLTAVETIAAYGHSGIAALIQISEESKFPTVRQSALEAISKIKKQG